MISHGKDIKIFTGNANPKLAADICKIIGTKLGESEVKSFADGEASVSLYETVRGSDVFLVQSTCKPVNDSLMELLIMVDACRALKLGVSGKGADPLALCKPAAHAGKYGNVRRQQKRLDDDRLGGEGIHRQHCVGVHIAHYAQVGGKGDGLDTPPEDHDTAAFADGGRYPQDMLTQPGFVAGNGFFIGSGGIGASILHSFSSLLRCFVSCLSRLTSGCAESNLSENHSRKASGFRWRSFLIALLYHTETCGGNIGLFASRILMHEIQERPPIFISLCIYGVYRLMNSSIYRIL